MARSLTLGIMTNKKHARVTRVQAAALAGVSTRTINRWSAEGLLRVWRGGWRDPAMYDLNDVLAARDRGRGWARKATAESEQAPPSG